MRLLFLFFVLSHFSCKNTEAQENDMAKKHVESRLDIVKEFLTKGSSEGLELNEAIDFLEELTNITSYSINEEYVGAIKIPNQYNLNDWTSWYELNKSKLAWNKTSQSVSVVGATIPLTKNPEEEFLRYLNIVKKEYTNNDKNLDELQYAVRFLGDLTEIQPSYNVFLREKNAIAEKTINDWKNWFEENKGNLFWDKTSNILRIK